MDEDDCYATVKKEFIRDFNAMWENSYKTEGQNKPASSRSASGPGVQERRDADLKDFAFDPNSTSGDEDMLAAMQAIQNPNWGRQMMMPGSADISFHALLVRLILAPL
jgi:hypothetical protein